MFYLYLNVSFWRDIVVQAKKGKAHCETALGEASERPQF